MESEGLEALLAEFKTGKVERKMNAKQSLKLAAQHIENMQRTIALNILDIRDYNKVIADMIAGQSPCNMCEDWEECQLEAKGGKGCSEWMLRMQKSTELDVNQEGENAGESVHVTGSSC